MNIEEIKKLADIAQQYKLSVLEVTEGETKIRLEFTKENTIVGANEFLSSQMTNMPIVPEQGVDFNDMYEIKTPMVGVFFASPSSDAAPFVCVGSKVKKGDVLCIIEAMKLMNEITAEKDGEIVDICVSNGSIVEYGQILFKIF